ncbi:MAG: hypothetical protein LBJ83_02265 [Oscillospiraceae bacterium]|jgi:hypothetical protein|nr:hypothetical protein [Oscillospiraceae bacterium]
MEAAVEGKIKRTPEAKPAKEKLPVKAQTKRTTTKSATSKSTESVSELTYKGLPLSRLKNEIYYGDPNEKYIVKLTVLDSKKWEDLEVASRVSVELLNSFNHNVCKKKSEKTNLYHALDIGQIWLKKILAE